jgi:hypothetical protein
MGKAPKADHVSSTFFCALTRFAGYSSKKREDLNQRCIGDKMVHWYLLNYTLAFHENYKDLSQWAFNHYTAAHE